MRPDATFWREQRVLLTGHTGFKGTWLSMWLERLGATTTGLALRPETDPSLYELVSPRLESHIADIRKLDMMSDIITEAQPTVAIHMAAQPLVRCSYRDPVGTMHANVMGTVNVLQALRRVRSLRVALVITTDKVYANSESGIPFGEDSPLGGHDPYSGSKAAAEIVTKSFADSFFSADGIPVATARAGNVVGGGDWAEDRLLPDLWRADRAGEAIILRNPKATRPWQHVLDLLLGYLLFVERLAKSPHGTPRALNFGPAADDTLSVLEVTEIALSKLGSKQGWKLASGAQPREMQLLALDATLAREILNWQPKFSGRDAILWAVEWYKRFNEGVDTRALCVEDIIRYEDLI